MIHKPELKLEYAHEAKYRFNISQADMILPQ